MKTRVGIALLLMIVTFVAGMGFQSVRLSVERSNRASFAGQTLTSLSQAIEIEKENKGAYPDSIVGLKVTSEHRDFSDDVLREVKYFKTEKGFIAFIGLPNVAYIHPGISAHFE